MSPEQLRIFVAVAESQHLTKAAEILHLSPSAVSASVKTLEGLYEVQLFDRVGRGLILTREGAAFLPEAKETLVRFNAAKNVLASLGSVKLGPLDLHASQTIANYCLPPRLLAFAGEHSDVEINVTIGNTYTVASAVLRGEAEIGFIEGILHERALHSIPVATDKLVIVQAAGSGMTGDQDIRLMRWVMRERGSGTRAVLEQGLREVTVDPDVLDVSLVLPSNEAVLAAVLEGGCVAALSESIVAPFIKTGQLSVVEFDLPLREFTLLRHRERHLTASAREFEAHCRSHFPTGKR